MYKKILISFFVLVVILCTISLLPLNKWVKLDDFKTNLVESSEWTFAQYNVDGKILTMMSTPVSIPHSKKLKLSGTITIQENQKNVKKDIPDLPLTIDLYGGPEFDSSDNDINITYQQVKASASFEDVFEITSKQTNLLLRIFHYFPNCQIAGKFELNATPNLLQTFVFLFNKVKANFNYILTFLIVGLLISLAIHIAGKNFIEKRWNKKSIGTNKFKLFKTKGGVFTKIFNYCIFLLITLTVILLIIFIPELISDIKNKQNSLGLLDKSQLIFYNTIAPDKLNIYEIPVNVKSGKYYNITAQFKLIDSRNQYISMNIDLYNTENFDDPKYDFTFHLSNNGSSETVTYSKKIFLDYYPTGTVLRCFFLKNPSVKLLSLQLTPNYFDTIINDSNLLISIFHVLFTIILITIFILCWRRHYKFLLYLLFLFLVYSLYWLTQVNLKNYNISDSKIEHPKYENLIETVKWRSTTAVKTNQTLYFPSIGRKKYQVAISKPISLPKNTYYELKVKYEINNNKSHKGKIILDLFHRIKWDYPVHDFTFKLSELGSSTQTMKRIFNTVNIHDNVSLRVMGAFDSSITFTQISLVPISKTSYFIKNFTLKKLNIKRWKPFGFFLMISTVIILTILNLLQKHPYKWLFFGLFSISIGFFLKPIGIYILPLVLFILTTSLSGFGIAYFLFRNRFEKFIYLLAPIVGTISIMAISLVLYFLKVPSIYFLPIALSLGILLSSYSFWLARKRHFSFTLSKDIIQVITLLLFIQWIFFLPYLFHGCFGVAGWCIDGFTVTYNANRFIENIHPVLRPGLCSLFNAFYRFPFCSIISTHDLLIIITNIFAVIIVYLLSRTAWNFKHKTGMLSMLFVSISSLFLWCQHNAFLSQSIGIFLVGIATVFLFAMAESFSIGLLISYIITLIVLCFSYKLYMFYVIIFNLLLLFRFIYTHKTNKKLLISFGISFILFSSVFYKYIFNSIKNILYFLSKMTGKTTGDITRMIPSKEWFGFSPHWSFLRRDLAHYDFNVTPEILSFLITWLVIIILIIYLYKLRKKVFLWGSLFFPLIIMGLIFRFIIDHPYIYMKHIMLSSYLIIPWLTAAVCNITKNKFIKIALLVIICSLGLSGAYSSSKYIAKHGFAADENMEIFVKDVKKLTAENPVFIQPTRHWLVGSWLKLPLGQKSRWHRDNYNLRDYNYVIESPKNYNKSSNVWQNSNHKILLNTKRFLLIYNVPKN